MHSVTSETDRPGSPRNPALTQLLEAAHRAEEPAEVLTLYPETQPIGDCGGER